MRILLLLAAASCLLAQSAPPLSPDATAAFPIWPGRPPGSEDWTWHEQTGTRGGNRMVRNVVTPTVTMYRPAEGKANGAAMIIAPGGAFRFLMVDYEGVDLARWLAQRGITAFVLKYRVIHTPDDERAMDAYLVELGKRLASSDTRSENPPHYDEATLAGLTMAEEDGRQAVRFVRKHAKDWSLDPHRIGIIGFSAGGGVVMGAVTSRDTAGRPDFAAPIYAAYRSATPVPEDAPPLFIAIADDDKLISPNSSARLYMAWHAAGRPAELHVFRRGDHGFGMKTLNRPSDGWVDLLYAWMDQSGFLKPAMGPVTRMFVFGDSYSDTGAGYVDGNGPTAVAYLAQRLGFRLVTPASADANRQSINFAVSGAQTGRGSGRKVKDALLGLGMWNQVDDFASRVESKAITFDPEHTLFFLGGGLNDRRLPGTETLANLTGQIRKLYGLGARRFRVALLPTAIPAFSEVGQRLNPELERIPALVAGDVPGADVAMSGWGLFFDDVMRNPSAYGIQNTTEQCSGRAIFGESDAACASPESHYYYHAGHPSTAVHKAVGDKLYAEVSASR